MSYHLRFMYNICYAVIILQTVIRALQSTSCIFMKWGDQIQKHFTQNNDMLEIHLSSDIFKNLMTKHQRLDFLHRSGICPFQYSLRFKVVECCSTTRRTTTRAKRRSCSQGVLATSCALPNDVIAWLGTSDSFNLHRRSLYDGRLAWDTQFLRYWRFAWDVSWTFSPAFLYRQLRECRVRVVWLIPFWRTFWSTGRFVNDRLDQSRWGGEEWSFIVVLNLGRVQKKEQAREPFSIVRAGDRHDAKRLKRRFRWNIMSFVCALECW